MDLVQFCSISFSNLTYVVARIDDSSHRLNFDLDKNKIHHNSYNVRSRNVVKCGKYSPANFVNFVYFVLPAEVCIIICSKVVQTTACNTKIYKICKI